MTSKEANPTRHIPPFHIINLADNRRKYFDEVLSQFVETYLFPPMPNPNDEQDRVLNYSLSLLQYYFILLDFKDAVKDGNGKHLSILHKQLLHHFKSIPGYNAYAIEMLISILQSEVFLSEAESHQVMWAGVVNSKGGDGKNIEIDLLQENQNRDIKNIIKSMGANKTAKAITRASKAAGGVRQIVDNFDNNANVRSKSSSHSHRSDTDDASVVLSDLRTLKPFEFCNGRKHKSFPRIEADNLNSLQANDFTSWLSKHQKNLLVGAPLDVINEENEEDESDSEEQT